MSKNNKIWAHSGDSHFVEPDNLWEEILPKDLASRMPWTEQISESMELVHVDGKEYHFPIPKIAQRGADGKPSIVELSAKPQGARDIHARLTDLDNEGIWGEVVYSSVGLWEGMIESRDLIQRAAKAENEWKAKEVQGVAPDRLIVVASVPMRNVEDAVSEVKHAADVGLHAVGLPTPTLPNSKNFSEDVPAMNRDYWEPLWATIEETGMVAAIHIGGDASEHTMYRGPGGAILNYTNSTYSGQRAAMVLVACGALDRHPKMKVLISEGGASWVPFLADRMEEGYRQHSMFVKPILKRSPREILYSQIYCSFQHENSAVSAMTAEGYNNVMFGSDYPHLEGTFGHTQETLHELFDGQSDDVIQRISRGSFEELFPHVSSPPSLN